MIGYFTKEQEKARKEQLKGYYTDEKELEQNATSPIELYPNLKLVPASLVCRPGCHIVLWWILYLVVLASLVGYIITCLTVTIHNWNMYLGWELSIIFISVALAISLCTLWGKLIYKKILHHPNSGYEKLVKEADYVSGNRGLCVFLKDEEFGVIKLWGCRVVIPPTYSYMEWEIYGKILRVKKDGRAFLIDIYGNEV